MARKNKRPKQNIEPINIPIRNWKNKGKNPRYSNDRYSPIPAPKIEPLETKRIPRKKKYRDDYYNEENWD